jgi:hypothetical protein
MNSSFVEVDLKLSQLSGQVAGIPKEEAIEELPSACRALVQFSPKSLENQLGSTMSQSTLIG